MTNNTSNISMHLKKIWPTWHYIHIYICMSVMWNWSTNLLQKSHFTSLSLLQSLMAFVWKLLRSTSPKVCPGPLTSFFLFLLLQTTRWCSRPAGGNALWHSKQVVVSGILGLTSRRLRERRQGQDRSLLLSWNQEGSTLSMNEV